MASATCDQQAACGLWGVARQTADPVLHCTSCPHLWPDGCSGIVVQVDAVLEMRQRFAQTCQWRHAADRTGSNPSYRLTRLLRRTRLKGCMEVHDGPHTLRATPRHTALAKPMFLGLYVLDAVS